MPTSTDFYVGLFVGFLAAQQPEEKPEWPGEKGKNGQEKSQKQNKK